MRVWAFACALVVLSFGVLAQQPVQRGDVSKLLSDARRALGGEDRLTAVRTFRIKGAIETGVSGLKNYGSFDIACELPDKYAHAEDRSYAGGSENARWVDGDRVSGPSRRRRVSGFNGNRVIYEPDSEDRRSQFGPVGLSPQFAPLPSQAQLHPLLRRVQADFARISLGMFAASFPAAPVAFSADTPDSVSVTGALDDPTAMTMAFDHVTHLPAALGNLRYARYRDVGGLKVPYRYEWIDAKGRVAEVWTVREVRFNVAIDPRVFKDR